MAPDDTSSTSRPPAPDSAEAHELSPDELAALPEDALLETIQRRTFRHFWEGAHPLSALALDRRTIHASAPDDKIATGGSGFGIMALVIAVERGWVTRAQALERLRRMLDFLEGAERHHGAFPHFMNGSTGATIPFFGADDGGDLVETSFLCMGLLCAREYFRGGTSEEQQLRERVSSLCAQIEWSWYTQGGQDVLYWHWSPHHAWAMNHPIRGWNECLITYVLAAGAQDHAIDPRVYHRGFAHGPEFLNGRTYYDIELPLGPELGGPLFFAHYSFCALDPRGLADRYADYEVQNSSQVRINHAHCSANPHGWRGYGPDCWGLTASDDPEGYAAHSPAHDNGTLSPTAALASVPYAPREALAAARHFLRAYGAQLWGAYGFADAFCPERDWFADTVLAIDQGPIIVMIENYRSGLPWRLSMRAPEIREGLRRLDFSSPHLPAESP